MRFLGPALLLALFFRFLSIFFMDLEWGVMDDAAWIDGFRRNYSELGLFSFLAQSFDGEIVWGLFRPTYMFWSYLVYGKMGVAWGWEPRVIYALTFFLYSVLALGWGWVLSRWFGKRLFLLGALGFVCFTPNLNLVNLISLQEKLALLGVLGALGFLLVPRRNGLTDGLSVLFFMAALGAKVTSFVYFLPVAFLILQRPSSSARNLYLGVYGATVLGWVIYARTIAIGGTYTGGYSLGNWDLARFFSAGGPWAYLVTAVLIAALAMGFKEKKLKTWIWPLTLFALLFVMLPWGVFGYYWAIVSFAFVACAMQVYLFVEDRMPAVFARAVLVVALAGSLFALGPKLQGLLNRSVETRQAMSWLGSQDIAEGAVFYIPAPCEEATGAIPLLAKKDLRFEVWQGQRSGEAIYSNWWECGQYPGDLPLTLLKDFGAWKFYRLSQ